MSEPTEYSLEEYLFPKDIQTECIDDLLGSLVGDADKEEAFKQALTDEVRNVSDEDPDQRYDRLSVAAIELARYGMMGALDRRIVQSLYRDIEYTDEMRWVLGNAKIGTRIMADGLRAVGGAYETFASAPQEQPRVEANVTAMARNVFGQACTSARESTRTASAYIIGVSPYSLAAKLGGRRRVSRAMADRSKRLVSARSLDVVEDLDGQLDIRLRHKPRNDKTEFRCPASIAKVGAAEGSKNGLYRYLNVLGDVAISSIYPLHTEIV